MKINFKYFANIVIGVCIAVAINGQTDSVKSSDSTNINLLKEYHAKLALLEAQQIAIL